MWKSKKNYDKYYLNKGEKAFFFRKSLQMGCEWKRNFWGIMTPTKVKCFTWLVTKRACLTHEVLQKKGRPIVTRCFLCEETSETDSHLFLHCRFTAMLWSMFFSLIGMAWTMPEHNAYLISCWITRGGSESQKRWTVISSCIWWKVWKERNGRCFGDKIESIHVVKWNYLVSLFFWCKENGIE